MNQQIINTTTSQVAEETLQTRYFRPCILVLDDEPDQLGALEIRLLESNIDAHVVRNTSEAQSLLENHSYELALLDVCLGGLSNNLDRSGIEFAKELFARAPEVPIIFISRPVILDSDAATVISMFNRQGGKSAAAGRVRLAEAYIEKSSEGQLLETVRDVLAETGFPTRAGVEVPIMMTADTLAEIQSDLKEKLGRGIVKQEMVAEPERQFLGLVRKLAYREYSEIKRIVVSKIAKGRSRTIVVSIAAHCGDGVHTSILKIAFKPTVVMERENYRANVPRLIRGGRFPALLAFAESKQYAGIAYSEIGTGEGLPYTLADEFFKLEPKALRKMYYRVVTKIICADKPPEPTYSSLFENYKKRFRALENFGANNRLYQTVQNVINAWKVCKADGKQTLELSIGNEPFKVFDPRWILTSRFGLWSRIPHFMGLVHGDLHLDNIILNSKLEPYLIDFSHTSEQHAVLDFVLMEAMVRSHLFRDVAKRYLGSDGNVVEAFTECCRSWCECEVLLFSKREQQLNRHLQGKPWQLDFKRMLRLIQDLRRVAKEKVYYEDLRLYQAGLGMTLLSFLALPDSGKTNKEIQRVLFLGATLALNNSIYGLSDTQPGVPSQESGLSVEKGIERQDFKLASIFRANSVRYLRKVREDIRARQKQAKDDSATGFLVDFGQMFPVTQKAIEEEISQSDIIHEYKKGHNDFPGYTVFAARAIMSELHSVRTVLKCNVDPVIDKFRVLSNGLFVT